MTFAAKAWLWAAAILPLLLVIQLVAARHRKVLLARLVASRLQPRLAGSVHTGKRWLRIALLLLALGAVVVALARPQWGTSFEQAKRRGRDVLILVDTSRSMLADDIKPSRLIRARLAAQDVIANLSGDRVGVIAFAGTAFLQAPLTVDYDAALTALKELDSEIIPQGGSNLEAALECAQEAFGKGESENRAIIVLSDGEELDADSSSKAQEMKGQIRIFSVGMGTPEGALIPVRNRSGGTEFVKDEAGNVVRSKLDESRLRAIAEATGGFYIHLQSGRTEMQHIVRDGLGAMAEQDIDARLASRPIERFQWPLAVGIAALAIAMLVGERKRRMATMTSLALFALGSTSEARNPGLDSYEKGNFEQAQEEFTQQLKWRPELPELEFNLATAAFKRGDYEVALRSFGRALTAENPALRTKAAYNLGNTLFRRGVSLQDKGSKIAEWKAAIQQYDVALGIDPKNADAAYNKAAVQKAIEELEKEQQSQKDDDSKPTPLSEEAKRVKAEADDAVRHREYRKAMELIDGLIQRDTSAKQFSDFLDRLRKINGVSQSDPH